MPPYPLYQRLDAPLRPAAPASAPVPRNRTGGGRRRGVHAACAVLLAFALSGCDRESRDYVRPVLTLNGQAVMSISYRETFSDPGVKATDDRDGAVTVIVTGAVQSGRVGEYTLTYTATDAAGNAAEATRVVRVVDDVPPTITLEGPAAVELERDGPFWDPGATAEDEIDGPVETTVRGEVGEAAGEYALVYRAVDAAGNAAEATRTVTRAPGNYMLNVNAFGEGEVRLAAGTATTPFRCEDGACFGRFREGERVELEATAGPGRRFDGWGTGVCDEIADGRCALTMDRNRIALPAFVSEEPLTMHDDVVMLTPEQIEGLIFWAPDAGVAAFDEWTDLRDLVPGSVMVSDGVPDEHGFPTEPAFLARVLSVWETLDGSQLVATAPAGLDDLYASGTLVASGELTRVALERAELAPGVKLAPAPEGSRSSKACRRGALDCTFNIEPEPGGPLKSVTVTVSGFAKVWYEPPTLVRRGRLTRVMLDVTADAGFTIGPGEWEKHILLGGVQVPLLPAPPILLGVALTLVPKVGLEGDFSDTVKGQATLVVVGGLHDTGIGLPPVPYGDVTRGFKLVDPFDLHRAAAEGKPHLRLGLELSGWVSVATVTGLTMGIQPYYGANFQLRTSNCELSIDPYWGVDARVDAFLRVWGFRERKKNLLEENFPGGPLSSITRTLACADTEPPTPPDGLTATRAGRDVELGWSASSDNRGVTAYHVYRAGVLIRTTGRTSLVDRNPGAGTHRYRVKAEDGAGNWSSDSVVASATVPPDDPPPSDPPAKPEIEITQQTVGSTPFTLLSWSPDEDGVEYSLWMDSPHQFQYDNIPLNPTPLAGTTAGVEYCYRIRAENSAGSRDSDSRCFTPEGNSPPTADAGRDFNVVAGKQGRLRGSGMDAEDGRVTGYAWTQTVGSTVSLSDASSATATFTAPAVTTQTTLTFQLTVTDDAGATGTDYMRATVLPVNTPANDAPWADAGRRQDVTTGETVTLSGRGSRDDSGIVDWRWEQSSGSPDVSLSGADSRDATFVAPRVSVDRTRLRFELTVTDGHGETDSDGVNVFVSPAPPVANAGADQEVTAGATVTLSGRGSSDDHGIVAWRWEQRGSGGPDVSLSGADSRDATFDAPQVSTRTRLRFELTVTDGHGETDSDRVSVYVSPANRPPVANAGANQSVAAGAAVTLNGGGSDDPDGTVAGYAWTQTGGRTVSLSGASSAAATFMAPDVTARTTLAFRLTVTDDDGATGADEATVTVSPPATNLSPVANAGPHQSVAAGAAVTLSGSGSDPDGTVAGYAWTQTGGRAVSLSGASSATATFKAPAATTSTTLTFRLTVTDNDGATGADDAMVTVVPADGDAPVNIPDAALRAELLAALDKLAGDTITRSDMAGLDSHLGIGERGVADLTGLEYATSLTSLTILDNSISDISALSALTSLTRLELYSNPVSDISALSGLTSLNSLSLYDHPVSDISALSGLTSLTSLILRDHPISDISALSGLTSLNSLGLYGNSISDISALSGLTSLNSLDLGGNSISDISALSRLTSLTNLRLGTNWISDISALSGLTSLNSLQLNDNSISDISALSGLTSLTDLVLGDNSISDISALSGLTSLRSLSLGGNSISDISTLSSTLSRLTSLRHLHLRSNSISDITALSGLTSLTSLDLYNNPISDISALSGLTSLTWLSLDENSISDISAMSGLTSLKHLDLDDNSISDAGPLVDNTGLGRGDRIYLRCNPLSAQSVNTHIPTLRARGATVLWTACSNRPPVANAGPHQSVAAGVAVTLSGSGSDADGDVAGYAWTQTGGPTVSLSGALSAAATFTAPAATTRTTLTFQLTVTDNDGATDSDTTRVAVSPANSSPVANAGRDQSVTSGATVRLRGSGSDADGDVAGYAWMQTAGPAVSLSGASSATATFTAPTVTTRTMLTFQLTVTDNGGATGADETTVMVSPPANLPPVANAGSDQSVAAGTAVTLSGSGSDPDGTVAGYVWTQTVGPTVSLSGASSATATFTAPAVTARTALTFRLTVTDDDSATAADDATVTVSPPATNLPPVANAGSNQSVASGAAVTLNGGGSDPDGTVAGYAWTQTAGPTVSLSGASSATATFTAPAVATRTALTFRLTVTDNGGATGAGETTVTVSPPAANRPPVASAGSDQSVASGAAVTLNGGGSDPDGSVAGYAWTQTAGPTVSLSGASSATATFTAPTVATSTTLTFRLTVTDDDGATGADDATVTVAPAPAVDNTLVNIPDAALRTALLAALGKSAGDTITRSEMAGLTSFTVRRSGVADLTGLEFATSLTFLRLEWNSISDISALSGLTSLTTLLLGGNSVSDISALSGLTTLTQLGLTSNRLSDISALSGLTSLRTLHLGINSISNISALSRLTSLTDLRLSSNRISDISVLSGLTSLDYLVLNGNRISDISALSRLTSLTGLLLGGNSISDISALSGLTSLTTLELRDNSISDISALSGLTSLDTLGLIKNQISDISALSGLTSLTGLFLGGNSISDFSTLSRLTSLTVLGIEDSSMSDISALSGLTSLTNLWIARNSISDISALSGLTSLRELDLNDNLIVDAKPLVDNTGLGSGDTVKLRRNPLSAQSVNTHIPAVRARGATVHCSLVDGTAC